MNIEQIQKTDNQNNDTTAAKETQAAENANKNQPKVTETKSFKQEMSAKQVEVDLLNLGTDELCNNGQSQDQAESNGAATKNQISPALMKSIQQFALKNNIPFKIKDINDIKNLMQSQEIFHQNEKQPCMKVDKIEKNDIDFLKTCIDNPNVQINMINTQAATVNYTINNDIATKETTEEVSYKSLNVSKTLTDMINYAYKTQKPVRLDFDGNSSVILKIDAEGKLTAEFISSDKAMESLLKSNLPNLRNKMDVEGLPYKDISYREQSSKNSKNYQQEGNSYE